MKRTREDIEPIKKYDDFKFIDNLATNLRYELIRFFGKDNGLKTYVYSLLGILYKNRYDWYKDNHNHSFISKKCPNIPVSRSSVASFIKQLGVYDSLNKEFLTSSLVDREILIFSDATFANDESFEFSEYNRKYKQTRWKQINKIKVFDLVRLEPVYYEVIPGNVIDKRAFISVLNKFNLKNTIIIIDRGFNSEENVQYLLENNINL